MFVIMLTSLINRERLDALTTHAYQTILRILYARICWNEIQHVLSRAMWSQRHLGSRNALSLSKKMEQTSASQRITLFRTFTVRIWAGSDRVRRHRCMDSSRGAKHNVNALPRPFRHFYVVSNSFTAFAIKLAA